MNNDFPVEKTVKARHSVRTYNDRGLSKEEKKQIEDYISEITNPFAKQVSFRLLDKQTSVNGEKLGTYGVIKGVSNFIGASVKHGDLALEALGYSFEKLILYATARGLGTCWIGGTFNRSRFAEAMNLKEGELFPCIAPIGHPKDKKRVSESMMRWMAKSDQRKEWQELFFDQSFSKALTKAEAGEYAFPLEMVRLAPSAVNKQPWRIIKDKNAYHFYNANAIKVDEPMKIDIHSVDMGIAACHFHLAVQEVGLNGSFEKLSDMNIQTPINLLYAFSWIC